MRKLTSSIASMMESQAKASTAPLYSAPRGEQNEEASGQHPEWIAPREGNARYRHHKKERCKFINPTCTGQNS